MAGGSSTRLKQRRSAASQSLNLGLRFGWIVLVIWCEIGEFFWSASACQWSKLEKRLSVPSTSSARPARSTRVLVLADPQVVNFQSPSSLRRPVKAKITQFILDTFLRKGWMVAKRFKPDAVFINGDMMHSGRLATSEGEYWAYANHFKSIFETPDAPPIFYVPGNRDVGLGPSRSFSTRARARYREAFGPINYTLDLGNHTFVMLDAPGLIEEDYRRYAAEVRFGEWAETETGTIKFVYELGEVEPHHPRILMSHVPLYRRERVDCGPHREKGFMTNDAGLGYQKLLGSETSEFLMSNVQPSLIFSGEDHDVCEFAHGNGVREVTVKTFSTGMGITHPGFQMLSLVPGNHSDPAAATHADMSCDLPDQLGIYTRVYFPLALATLALLLALSVRRSWQRRKPAYLNLGNLHGGGSTSHGAASSSILSPNPSRRQSSSAPIKSPRIPASGLMAMGGMTPLMAPPGSMRRPSSRSVPPSPLNSPRIGYTSELEDVESDAVFDGGRAGSIYGHSQHSYPPYNGNGVGEEYSQSPSPIDEGQGSSYFLPMVNSNNGSSVGLGLGLSMANSPAFGSSRPGQTRRVTRMSEKDSRSLARAAAAGGGERGVLGGLWADLRPGTSVWGCLGGDDVLLVRWLRESWRVFWPAAATFVLINLYFTF